MPINPTAIYSKSGKGVQEASGKTSLLSRADRAVLGAFDGKMTVKEVAEKVGRPFDQKFEDLITKLDNDGFVRQVSAGTPPPSRPGAAPAKGPATKPPAGGGGGGEDLDFTVAMPAPKATPKPPPPPPAPPVAPHMAQSQAAAFARAREEAEEKAAKERERIKAEAEAKMRAEMEAKARSEAEAKAKADAEARVRAEAEAKVKAAREAAVKAAAEAKAKAEAEAERARKEAEEIKRQAEEAKRRAEEEARRAREEAEAKARKEAEEAKRQAEEAKRKAEEEARKAREEAERIKREAEEARRQAEEAKRKAEEEARKAREEAERKAKEEAERRRREEEARKAREEQERREREAREKAERERAEREKAEREARERAEAEEREARRRQEREAQEAEERAEKERRAREKAEREAREREEEEREERERAERKARERAEREQREREEREREEQERAAKKAAAAKPEKPQSFGDSLLADLDSFSQRDDEERKEKEEKARREKEEAARRAQEQAERRAKEEAERREQERRREEEARRKEEEERRLREEEERTREEIRRAQEKEREEAERRRAARAKEEARAAPADDDDIPLSDDDLDLDDVKQDEAQLSKESRRAAREREERERRSKKEAKREAKRAEREAKEKEKDRKKAKVREEAPAPPPQFRRPRKWGKTVSTLLFLALVAGVGVLHVMPISTAEYEAAASRAFGQSVKIGSARLSLYSGVILNLKNVTVGEAKIATVRAHPEIGSLFDPKKAFSRIEVDGATVPQTALAGLFGAKVRSDAFRVEKIEGKNVKLAGPLTLPALEIDLAFGEDGGITSTSVRGPDGLAGKIVPKGSGELDLDIVAHSFTVPIVPDMSLSGFAMKGTATPDGMRIESWGGSSLDGGVQGSANVRWAGGNWNIDGVMTVRGINAAVFAPALLSEGKAEGSGRFSFNDPDPNKFLGRGRIEGTFSVHKGVLGSFDLSRAIQTGGRQAAGRTPFTGMSGQGVFDKGAVALRNVSFGAGALAAGASADISPEGQLSGRIVADVRTPSQTLRATLVLGGTVRDPQVRN